MRRLHPLPTLWLMTDERVDDARLLRAVERLPRGSGVVFRHYRIEPAARRALFDRVRHITRRRGLRLMLAGDEATALRWGADGRHGGTGRARLLPLSAAVHDGRELRRARQRGAAFVFVSPLLPTRSHPEAEALGPFRFAALARRSGIPVMALGGVGPRHAGVVRRLGAAGWGAIDALIGNE